MDTHIETCHKFSSHNSCSQNVHFTAAAQIPLSSTSDFQPAWSCSSSLPLLLANSLPSPLLLLPKCLHALSNAYCLRFSHFLQVYFCTRLPGKRHESKHSIRPPVRPPCLLFFLPGVFAPSFFSPPSLVLFMSSLDSWLEDSSSDERLPTSPWLAWLSTKSTRSAVTTSPFPRLRFPRRESRNSGTPRSFLC